MSDGEPETIRCLNRGNNYNSSCRDLTVKDDNVRYLRREFLEKTL